MTNDTELDALLSNLKTCSEYLHLPPSVQSIKSIRCMEAMDKAADAITTLRAQLAEARADRDKVGRALNVAKYGQPDFAWEIHKMALQEAVIQRDHAKAERDAAQAALAAQIEADAKSCDRIAGNTKDFFAETRRAAGMCAAAIRTQPHDRATHDRLIAEAVADERERCAKIADDEFGGRCIADKIRGKWVP